MLRYHLYFSGQFSSYQQYSSQPYPTSFFPLQSPVIDYPYGNVADISKLLLEEETMFVMFYAPWCARSLKLKHEFEKAAKFFENEVGIGYLNLVKCLHFHNSKHLSFTLYAYGCLLYLPLFVLLINKKLCHINWYLLRFLKFFVQYECPVHLRFLCLLLFFNCFPRFSLFQSTVGIDLVPADSRMSSCPFQSSTSMFWVRKDFDIMVS